MRFTRNNKIFRGQLDVAPLAGVFFLLVIFLILNSSLVFTPGVRIHLPAALDLPGTTAPTVVVAVDASGQFYFENQVTPEAQLRQRLHHAVQGSSAPLTLVVAGDKAVQYDVIVRLGLLAREVGFQDVLLATRPTLRAVPTDPMETP